MERWPYPWRLPLTELTLWMKPLSCYLCVIQVEDNVTVILLSEIVWDKFRPNTGCFEPLLLHFPDYSKGIIVLTHATPASVANISLHAA